MLRIIGDIHGDFEQYAEITRHCAYSVQLGDFGFCYTGKYLDDIDPYHHRFFGGNHDNYDIYRLTPRALGDYGVACMGGVEFFYIRGAFSIDFAWRMREYQNTGRKIWWKEEELDNKQMVDCLALYMQVKPRIVITHDCPRTVSKMVGDTAALRNFRFDPDNFTTPTQELLESCIEVHQPEYWYFGHYHKNWQTEWCQTKFICINAGDYVDV